MIITHGLILTSALLLDKLLIAATTVGISAALISMMAENVMIP
jgi:hypothetical protein